METYINNSGHEDHKGNSGHEDLHK